MQTKDLIEKQIASCRELLAVFKSERETYGGSDSVNLNVVVKMIKRKQDILQSFSKQKEIMLAIKENGHQNEEAEKCLLRELGSILEQLLVIDQENEVLLRELLSKKPGRATQKPVATNLSPELPFCPGKKNTNKALNPPVKSVTVPEAKIKSDKLQEKLNLFSRNKLKAYGA